MSHGNYYQKGPQVEKHTEPALQATRQHTSEVEHFRAFGCYHTICVLRLVDDDLYVLGEEYLNPLDLVFLPS